MREKAEILVLHGHNVEWDLDSFRSFLFIEWKICIQLMVQNLSGY